MYPAGSYVVFGAKCAPQVHLIGAAQVAKLRTLQSMHKLRRSSILLEVFGTEGAEYALPAWSVECMATIAEDYTGPHQIEVRGICAAIALGQPLRRDGDGKPHGGGEKVPRNPVKPRPSSPAKAVADFFSVQPAGVQS